MRLRLLLCLCCLLALLPCAMAGADTVTYGDTLYVYEGAQQPHAALTITVGGIGFDAASLKETRVDALPGAVFGLYAKDAQGRFAALADPQNPLLPWTVVSDGKPVSIAVPASVDLYLHMEEVPQGYLPDADVPAYLPVRARMTAGYTLRQEGMQGVWLTLLGETPLSGVSFVLEGEGKQVYMTTGETGQAAALGLPEGEYTLRQLTVPEGYAMDTPEVQLTIDDTAPTHITLTNSKEGTLALRPMGLTLDAARNTRLVPLDRAYRVTGPDGAEHGVLRAGESLSLPASAQGIAYTLTAVGGENDGFMADAQAHTVTLHSGQMATCQPVMRSESGFFTFAHISDVDGTPVPGGVFTLADASGADVYAFEADGQGLYEAVKPLPAGVYTIRQTVAAKGYLYTGAEVPVEITPFFDSEETAHAALASAAVPGAMTTPEVAATQAHFASLFSEAAQVDFTLSLTNLVKGFAVDELRFDYDIPQLPGLTIEAERTDGAALYLAHRYAVPGAEEVTELRVTGQVSYTFDYPVDEAGGTETVRVSAPFDVIVAVFDTYMPIDDAVWGGVRDASGEAMADFPVALEANGFIVEEIATDFAGAYLFTAEAENAAVVFDVPSGYGVRQEGAEAFVLPLVTVEGRVQAYGVEGYPVTLSYGDAEPIAPDEQGHFAFTGLFDAADGLAVEAGDGILTEVDMQDGLYVVSLYAQASVAGQVLTPEGEPVPGAEVAVSGADQRYVVSTDARGLFRVDGLMPGTYTVEFKAPQGYVNNGETMRRVVQAGESAGGMDAEMMRPARVEGTVRDGDAACEGVCIRLLPQNAEVLTDESGYFAFDGLSAGTYVLDVVLPEDTLLLTALEPIEITQSGQRVEQALQTVRPASLSGRIWYDANNDGLLSMDEGGQADVQLWLLDAQQAIVDMVVTGANGGFRFDGLLPGVYQVRVLLPEGMIFAREASGTERLVVGVEAQENVSAWYTLSSGQHLEGLIAGAVRAGSVSGSFWEDLNGDGAHDAAEPWMQGIRVVLSQGGKAVREAVTDEQGGYRFASLREGTYTLSATLPEGHLYSRQPGGDGLVSGFPANDGVAAEVSVSLRRDRMEAAVHGGVQRTGSLQGHVWLDTEATGVNPGVSGYGGLLVSLVGADGKALRSQMTDTDGNVCFDGIRPGSYTLAYRLPETEAWGITAGADGQGNSVTIAVGSGDSISAEPLGITRLGVISGVVFEDADYDGLRGEAEQGLSVGVMLTDAVGTVLANTTSGADGAYAFEGLKAGRYTVQFVLPETHAFTKNRSDAPSYNSDVPQTASLTGQTEMLYLPMGEKLLADAGAYGRASISGALWQDVNDDGVYAEGNPPLAGMLVALIQDEAVYAQAYTAADGTYRFADLPPGTYSLRVTLPEGMRFSESSAGSERRSRMPRINTLTADTDVIVLRNAESLRDMDIGAVYTGAIAGQVAHTQLRTGLEGVGVTLLRHGIVLAQTTTDAAGRYQFADMRPGPAQVRFALPEAWIPGEDAVNPQPVTLLQGQTVAAETMHAQPEAVLAGSLWLDGNADGLWDEGEVALLGAQVELFAVQGEEEAPEAEPLAAVKTDSSGVFRFDGLYPGVYRLRLTPPRGMLLYAGDESQALTLVIGETKEWTAAAYIASTVEGIVFEDLDNDGLHGDGEPLLAGVPVMLLGENKVVLQHIETGEDGAYRFEDVPPVACRVRFTLPQGYMFTAPAEGGSVVPLTDAHMAETEAMALEMGETYAGISAGALRHTRIGDLVWLDANGNGLQDTDEAGIPGVIVQLWQDVDDAPVLVAETKTDNNGRYRFDAVRPGSYRVTFECGDGYLPTRPVALLDQINSKLPWVAQSSVSTEPFLALSGIPQLTVDAGLVTTAMAEGFGWVVGEDGAITE